MFWGVHIRDSAVVPLLVVCYTSGHVAVLRLGFLSACLPRDLGKTFFFSGMGAQPSLSVSCWPPWGICNIVCLLPAFPLSLGVGPCHSLYRSSCLRVRGSWASPPVGVSPCATWPSFLLALVSPPSLSHAVFCAYLCHPFRYLGCKV